MIEARTLLPLDAADPASEGKLLSAIEDAAFL